MNHKYHITALTATLALAGVSFEVNAIGPTPPSWEPRELVAGNLGDLDIHEGSNRTLAFDHHGNPAIAFFDSSINALRYARRVPGLGWIHGVVDAPVGGSIAGGLYPSLAFDRYERPAISYVSIKSTGDHEVRFAHFDGTTWNTETVSDPPSADPFFTSLAFDHLGRAAITYEVGGQLVYYSDTDGDFTFGDELGENVSIKSGIAGSASSTTSSLAFDPLNRPMIAHYDSNNTDLLFSVKDTGFWSTTSVDEDRFVSEQPIRPSLAIDPDTGHPAIASYDLTSNTLRYDEWNGSQWSTTSVDSFFGFGSFGGISPSLAFDPAPGDGNPAIAYYDQDSAGLMLAWHDGTIWQTQVVDGTSGTTGPVPSLAFNDFGTGFPSIAYFDGNSSGLDNIYFIEDPLPVPEPGSFLLAGLGLLSLCGSAWPRHLGPVSGAP